MNKITQDHTSKYTEFYWLFDKSVWHFRPDYTYCKVFQTPMLLFFFLLHLLFYSSCSLDSFSSFFPSSPFFPILLSSTFTLDLWFGCVLCLSNFIIKAYLNDQSALRSISLLTSYMVGNFHSPGVNWVASSKSCKFIWNP